MRGSVWRTAGYVAVGAVLGTIAGQLLSHQLPFLGHDVILRWSPGADLSVVQYSLNVMFRFNWLTLVGIVVAFYLRKKIR